MPISSSLGLLAACGLLLLLGSHHPGGASTAAAETGATDLTAPGAALERIATGYEFSEGPAADAEGNVFFSDAPANRIILVPPGGPARIWKSRSRGANGMLFDRRGRLVTCNSQLAPDGRTVTRYERDGRVTLLADRYQGKKLNSPNDLAIDSAGRIYFTDPRYGPAAGLEQDRMAVYRIETDGRLVRVIDDVQVPNGILITPDDRTLYVADNNPAAAGARTLVAYDAAPDGTIRRRGVLHDFGTGRGIDGMVLDVEGNIYATAGEGEKTGVYVFTPAGRLLQFIRTPETATNCTFGGAGLKTLYITAGKSLYSLRMRNAGRLVYPSPAQTRRTPREASLAGHGEGPLLGAHSQNVVTGAAAGGYAAFPDLCRTRDGDLFCVFYSGYGHVSQPRADGTWDWGGRILAARSSDGGRSWSRPFPVVDTPHDDRDPHVSRLSNGTLVLTWFTTWDPANRPPGEPHPHGLFFSTGSPDGRLWSAPQRIRPESPHWWACSAPVRELRDGTWILGIYTEASPGRAWGATISSRDGGRTWSAPATIGEHAGLPLDAETDVIALRDGRLLAALRSSRVNLHFAESADQGATWSAPRDSGFRGHCPLFLRLRSGIILLAHRVPNTALHWSPDEGATWIGPVQIDTVSGAYPGLVELDAGEVYCVYYEEGPGSGIRGQRLKVSHRGIAAAD